MKMQGYRTCPREADVTRELRIGSHDPTTHGASYVGIEVGDLPARVYARVSSAGANNFNAFSRHATQCTLDEALNGA